MTTSPGCSSKLARGLQPQAWLDEQARMAIVLQPFGPVGDQIGAGSEVGAIFVDPGAQPLPVADQRLVADLDRAAAVIVAGDDEAGIAAGEGLDHGQHVAGSAGSVIRARVSSRPSPGVTRLTNRRLAAACCSGRQPVVDLVGALLERLLQASILAEADPAALGLGPGLLERVLEQRQLADVVLVALAAR